jgi:hypothetical protein
VILNVHQRTMKIFDDHSVAGATGQQKGQQQGSRSMQGYFSIGIHRPRILAVPGQGATG